MKHHHPTTTITGRIALLLTALTAIFALAACDNKKQAGTGGDPKKQQEEPKEPNKGEDKHEDHDHEKNIAGPHGGRVLTIVEPHAEFLVTADRKVEVTFVDDDLKPVPAGDQSVTVTAGDRSDPTFLEFMREGDKLVSDKSLPGGNDFPVIVTIKTDASAKALREKFNLDLSDCPTCDYKEYACVCYHDEDE